MKTIKFAALSTAILIFSFSALAQKTKSKNNASGASGASAFDGNSKVINIGIGFGGLRYYAYPTIGAYKYSVSPAFSISYEQALKNKVGPGYIGIGAYFGFQTSRYRYDDWYYNGIRYYYEHKWTNMFVAARGAYHLDVLSNDKAELYFGLILGLRIQKYSYNTNSLDPNSRYYALSQGSVFPGYSLFVGGRYYLTNNIGLFAEFGYGISYLTGGVSIKL